MAFCAVLYADQLQFEREDGKGIQVRTEPIANAIGNAMVIFRVGLSMTYDEEITDERLEHEVEKAAKALGHALRAICKVTTAWSRWLKPKLEKAENWKWKRKNTNRRPK